MAWRDLAEGGVDICFVPGADSGLTLVQPNVQTLAEEFRARLALLTLACSALNVRGKSSSPTYGRSPRSSASGTGVSVRARCSRR